MVNFQNSVLKVYMATPIDVVIKCLKICHGKSVKSCGIYLTKKIQVPLKLSLLSGSR